MADEKVSLAFVLDEAAQKRVESRVSTLAEEMAKLGVTMDQIKGAKFGDDVAKEVDKATKATKEKLNPALVDTKKTMQEARAEARLLRAEAAAIVDGFEKARLARIRAVGNQVGGISRRGLAVGGALVGGILAEAGRFAREAELAGKATQATREWTAATQELAQARTRVDNVLLKESIPLIQQAARVATQVSTFIERNPVIIRAALETGKIVAGLSVLGILASKGIALYADAKAVLLGTQELTAAKLQDDAANKQLIAARIQAGAAGADIPGGGATKPTGVGGLVGNLGLIGAFLAASTTIILTARKAFNSLGDELIELGGTAGAAGKGIKIATEGLLPFLRQRATGGTAGVSAIADLGGNLATSTSRDQVVAAWEKWQEEDARIVQQAAENRIKIVREAESRIAAATAQFASRVTNINAQADRRAADLTADFLQANAEAETQYQEQRAQAIEDGNQEIRDIQESHQERLRQMEQDHNERVEDLTSSRDALGLAKEQRRFNQEVAEENRSTRQEIAKRRADLAERLAELDQQNQAEKAQRLVAFQEALAENEAQRKEELKQAAAAHAEELKQIRDQRAQQLRELQEGLNAERIRRREVFIEQIRDLDASLLGERALRARHYAEMLQQSEAFFAAWRAQMPSATTNPPPGFAVGGYAAGIVQTGEKGVEFIMSNRTTRAAEGMIGGRLTQDALLGALARGTGSRRSLTVNDHSRFDGRISAAQVRAIKNETISQIARELG